MKVHVGGKMGGSFLTLPAMILWPGRCSKVWLRHVALDPLNTENEPFDSAAATGTRRLRGEAEKRVR